MSKRTSCPRCGKRFPSEGRMMAHAKDKHGMLAYEDVQEVSEASSARSQWGDLIACTVMGFAVGFGAGNMFHPDITVADTYRTVAEWVGGLM